MRGLEWTSASDEIQIAVLVQIHKRCQSVIAGHLITHGQSPIDEVMAKLESRAERGAMHEDHHRQREGK